MWSDFVPVAVTAEIDDADEKDGKHDYPFIFPVLAELVFGVNEQADGFFRPNVLVKSAVGARPKGKNQVIEFQL